MIVLTALTILKSNHHYDYYYYDVDFEDVYSLSFFRGACVGVPVIPVGAPNDLDRLPPHTHTLPLPLPLPLIHTSP